MTRTHKECILIAAGSMGVASVLAGSRCEAGLLQLVGLLLCLPLLLVYWLQPIALLWRGGWRLAGKRSSEGREWWPDRLIARLLVAHGIASVLFFPLSLSILPLIHPGGTVLEGVHLTNALIAAPVAAPLLLLDRTLGDLTERLPRYPSSAWFWPNYLLPLAAAFAAVSLPHWRQARRARRSAMRICTHCGYDLRASKDRCPECATPIPEIKAGL